jgi:hypothetical protein
MADPIISVHVDSSRLNLKLDKLAPEVRDALLATIFIETGILAGRAQARAEERLQMRTGKFLRKIRPWAKARGENRVYGGVDIRDPRANLFEWGGTTPPHEITPDSAKALRMKMAGGEVFAKRVMHPGGKYDARTILHTPFGEMKPEIEEALYNAVETAAQRAMEVGG